MFTTNLRRALTAVAVAAGLAASPAAAEETIKIGYMDPFSGTFATVGDQNLKQFQFVIDRINAAGGALGRKFEMVTCDTKTQASEALVCLKNFTDQGLPIFFHCSGSNLGAALIEATEKHNRRNPDNRILYMNCGAVATELTGEKCSYWHFRFDANVLQKVKALVAALPETVKSVYLLNQDYLFGQSVSRDAKLFLAELRPDIEIVGDELIPLGKVKDFQPYITKINASGADAIITGNWGPDMSLFVRAGMDAGIDTRFYTMYAHLGGGPTAIGEKGNGKVFVVQAFNPNVPVDLGKADAEAYVAEFQSGHDFDFYGAGFRTTFEMLVNAINEAESTDPEAVAGELAGMRVTNFLGEEWYMRPDDHQLMSDYYIAVFSDDVKYDSEDTGLGWKTDVALVASQMDHETACEMRRP